MDHVELARLARLEAQVAYLLHHLGIDPSQAAQATPGSFASPNSTFASPADAFGSPVETFSSPAATFDSPAAAPAAASNYPPGVLAALDRGRMIEAIKIYREATGVGLKEAKKAVEGIAQNRR
jgi:hypothetical protein